MDARSAAAVHAVHLVVSQANIAAVEENARLRRAVERAVAAIDQGDRVLALRLLAVALNQEPVPLVPLAPRVVRRARGQRTCAMCGVRKRFVLHMDAFGQYTAVPPRRLCGPCFRLQPPQD